MYTCQRAFSVTFDPLWPASQPLSLALVSFSPPCFLTDSLPVGHVFRPGRYMCVMVAGCDREGRKARSSVCLGISVGVCIS